MQSLSVDLRSRAGGPKLRAVDDVSFDIGAGETLGLVGQSGSGKSTIGRALLGLVPIANGAVTFDGVDVTHAGFKQRRALSSRIQVVFQDPYSSLNPARKIGLTLAEPLRVRGSIDKTEKRELVRSALERVGLPAEAANRYPAHFSGGQRQRIAIARALILSPRLVILDEPVSALDLSVQAQILNLLATLQKEVGLSYLFISHDLAVVRYLSQHIAVLKGGHIVEYGSADDLYRRPAHPYTRALLAAAPVPDPAIQRGRSVALMREQSGLDAKPVRV